MRPFPDHPPLWEEPDQTPLREIPRATPLTPAARLLRAQVADPVDRWLQAGVSCPARNVNALGEVPRSSWFLPHTLRRPVPPRQDEPETDVPPRGPSLLAPWKLLAWGRDEAGPYVDIRDEPGARFRLRFDAPGFPRLATTAAVVASRLLARLGYRTARKHLVLFTPDQLARPGCRAARAAQCWPSPLVRLLARVPRGPDGSLRAAATRLLDAVPLGPFPFSGTRPGDPHDRLDHALRRELRGLRAVAAWLHLTGVTDAVPEDVLLRRRRVVIHRLGGRRGGLREALGATRSGRPKPLQAGFVPELSAARLLGQLASLGWLPRPWARLRARRARQVHRWPGVGWLPVAAFQPAAWRPRLDNQAFALADAADLHWAARRIARLAPKTVRKIVASAYLPAQERQRLVRALLARRRKVLAAWLGKRAPLGEVTLDPASRRLCVTDLWARAGLGAKAGTGAKAGVGARAGLGVRANPGPRPRAASIAVRVRPGPRFLPQPEARYLSRSPRLCLALPSPSEARRRWGAYAVLELARPDVSARWLQVHLRLTDRRIRLAGLEW